MPLRDATTRSRAASHLSAPCAEHKFPKRSGENPVRRRWERGMVSPFRSGCPLPFRRTTPRPAEGRPSNGRTPYTNAKTTSSGIFAAAKTGAQYLYNTRPVQHQDKRSTFTVRQDRFWL